VKREVEELVNVEMKRIVRNPGLKGRVVQTA
jgi:hypothetical protein